MTDKMPNQAPYKVFEGSAWEAGLLKSILEDNNIGTFLTEACSLPWNTIPLKGASAKVFVASGDLDRATVVVKEFYSNMQKKETDDPQE